MLGSGKPLSRVQAQAIELLVFMEIRDKAEDREEALKRALVSADKALYPALYQTQGAIREEEVTEEALTSGESTQWQFEKAFDPQQAEEILSRLASTGGGIMTMQDVEREEGDDGW